MRRLWCYVIRVICSASAANAVGIVVSTRDNLVCHVAVAATASVCGITVSCAGRPCDLRSIAVSMRRLWCYVIWVICSASAANAVGIAVSTRDNLVCHVAVAATASVCGITVSCAGRPCDLRSIDVSMWGIVISAGLIFMAVAVICRSVSGVA